MAKISLKKLLSKKQIYSLVNGIIGAVGEPLSIQDNSGNTLYGDIHTGDRPKFAIRFERNTVGWVAGGEKARPVALFVSYLLTKEIEKKEIARDTLQKYKELSIIYKLSEKINTVLDQREVAKLILEEAKNFVHFTNGSVMLFDEKTRALEILSTHGEEYYPKMVLKPGKGIAGSIYLSGNAEIINEAWKDKRHIPGANSIHSLICSPLKSKDRVLGVLNLSCNNAHHYTARDLKITFLLASQAAWAIENAILHENKIKEERLKSHLERYVSPQIVDTIIDTQDSESSLSPRRKEIAILFSDIRSFSTKCEQLLPEEIVKYLNEYFSQLVEIIFEQGGTLNKFQGDMILAFFGAPSKMVDIEKRAIETAIRMQRKIKSIPNKWIRENFLTGIGISSGSVVVGNIGSPRHLDYTAIGDEVNIGDRLQSLAKGGQILVSKSVYEAAKDSYKFREFGSIKVKGKDKKVEVHEVIY
jgi:class 3 adenylate cyclase/putative methionine-R-sulfoxide reductase with GAF domain